MLVNQLFVWYAKAVIVLSTARATDGVIKTVVAVIAVAATAKLRECLVIHSSAVMDDDDDEGMVRFDADEDCSDDDDAGEAIMGSMWLLLGLLSSWRDADNGRDIVGDTCNSEDAEALAAV